MADNSRAWMAVHTKGSKQMRQRLNAAQANNPAYQEFIQKHGLGDIASAKQSEMTAKKPKAMSPTAPEPNDGSKDRLAAIKAAAEKARQRKELDKRRAAMSDWGGTGGKMGGFSMPSFRTYREEVEQVDEKDLTGALRKSIESKGKHTVARNKAGTLVLRKMKKEEAEQTDEAVRIVRGQSYKAPNTQSDGSQEYTGDKSAYGSSHRDELAKMAKQARKTPEGRAALKPNIPRKPKGRGLERRATDKGYYDKQSNVVGSGNKSVMAITREEVELQEQFKTKEAAHTYAIANSKDGYDIDVYKHPNGSYHVNHEMNSQGRNWLIKAGAKKVGVASKGKIKEEVEYIEEKLTAADPASTWISDFVKSDNPKFAGKSKKQRMDMALGAYYAKKREKNEEVVQEKLDPVGKETTDIDNDKDVDKTDRYLHARRQAIGKAIARKKGM